MADPYQIPLSADNITSYLEKVRDASITIADDSRLVRNSAIYNKFAATDASVAANTADIEAIKDTGGAAYTFADTVNYDGTGALGSAGGWAAAKASTWSSIESGVVTISETGVYMVFVQGTFVEKSVNYFSPNSWYKISVNIDGVVAQNAHIEHPTTAQDIVDIALEPEPRFPRGVRVDTQKIVNLTSGTTAVSITATKHNDGKLYVKDCGITILKLA